MDPKVNPVAAPDDELTTPEAPQAEPVAAPEQEPAVSRRSRRELWRKIAEVAQREGAAQVDEAAQKIAQEKALAEIAKNEAFQAYQAEQTARLTAEQQRAARLERQMAERASAERKERLKTLEAALDDDSLDPDDRRAARMEYIALANQDYADDLRRWDEYKRSEIVSRGLDPYDPLFNKQYSPGQVGLVEFQADLHAAENAKLRKDLESAKKSAVAPNDLAELVRKELAKVLTGMGLDQVDLGEPSAPSQDDDAWERDLAAFQAGRMSPAAYTKKWGGGRK